MEQERSGFDNVLDDEEDDGRIAFETIYSNLILNEEIVLTVDASQVSNLKTGIKNIKNRQATQSRADGLVPVSGTLVFSEAPSADIPGAVDVTVTLSKKGAIKILGMRVPDPSF